MELTRRNLLKGVGLAAVASLGTKSSTCAGDDGIRVQTASWLGDVMAADRSEALTSDPSRVSVVDHGAVGDGVADDTAAFTSALDAVGGAGGGIVTAPGGRYRINGHLSLPVGVALEGTFRAVPSHTGVRDRGALLPEYGTVLLAYADAGTEDGEPFIAIGDNATLSGVVVYYPEQVTAGKPIPYPWTVRMRGNNPSIVDVELLNPYNGIDCTSNQRHLIRNVHGQPLRRGVYVNAIYDIGRLENVHFNLWFSMEHGGRAVSVATGKR